jgi:hypothetical protein
MNRLIALVTGIIMSIFLITAVHAASDKEAGKGKPAPEADASVKAYHDTDKQRLENKARGQKARQQMIDRDGATKAPQTGK